MERLLTVVADTAMVLSAVPMLGYVVRYWRGSAWRSTAAGRATFWQALSTVLLMGIAMLTVFGGMDAWARPYLRLPIYLLLLWTSIRMYATLATYQRFARGQADDPDRPSVESSL